MKFKTTGKQIKENYHKVIRAGYCDVQHLTRFREPIAYSCGVYGWNCDYYDIDGVIVATGYRGVPQQNTNVSHQTIREFEKKAEKLVHDYDLDYEERKEKVESLLKELVSIS